MGKGDFRQHIETNMYPLTKKQVHTRESYEQALTESLQQSVEQEKASWLAYITFERQEGDLSRAKLLFERALI